MNTCRTSKLLFDVEGLQALEGGDGDVGYVGVEGFLGVFVIVASAGEADADAVGDVADAGLPDLLVELGVNSHIRSAHHARGELADDLDGARRLSLEAVLSQLGVEVDGVLARHHFGSLRFAVFSL